MSKYLSDKPKDIQQVYVDAYRLWLDSWRLLPSFTAAVYFLTFSSLLLAEILQPFLQPIFANFSKLSIALNVSIFITLFYFIGFAFHRILFFAEQKPQHAKRSVFKSIRLLPTFLIAITLANFVFFIGLALLIIPGIIILTYYTMIAPSIYREQYGPINAIQHSCNIVAGNFWRTFLTTVAPGFIASSIAILLLYSLMTVVGTNASMPLKIGISIIIAFVASLSSTFYLSLVTIQFNDLKVRFIFREKHTLEHVVEA